jgi:SAM-dependent methyltransferase
MVAEYNKYAREMGFDPGRMQAYRHNLLDDEQTSLPVGDKLARNFDVAVTSGALHHVSDPAKLLQCLAKCLKADGGVCVVMDRAPSPTNTHVEAAMSSSMPKVLNTINKHTFSEVEMRQLYANAGMSKNFDYVLLPEPFEFTLQGNRMKVCGFLARGELD